MKFDLNINTAIEVLEKNLADHIVEVKEATGVWTAKMIASLEEFRDALDRKGLQASANELQHLLYTRPSDTRMQYSRYIGALKQAKAAGQTTVTVDEDDYDRIFNDNWEWRVQSKTSNAMYSRG